MHKMDVPGRIPSPQAKLLPGHPTEASSCLRDQLARASAGGSASTCTRLFENSHQSPKPPSGTPPRLGIGPRNVCFSESPANPQPLGSAAAGRVPVCVWAYTAHRPTCALCARETLYVQR